MQNFVLESKGYVEILKKAITKHSQVRGFKKQLAKAAGCHPSFLSQALAGKVHLTPDHAFGIQSDLEFAPLEGQYFLNLVEIARSAHKDRRSYLMSQNREIKKASMRVEERLGRTTVKAKNESSSAKSLTKYYSSWYYPAVHLACSIPGFQSCSDISSRLHLDETKTLGILKELEEMQMVERDPQTENWVPLITDQFVKKGSLENNQHQKNLRLRLSSDAPGLEKEVFYGGIYSIDQKTAKKIKALLLDSIVKARNLAAEAPETDLYGIHVDFYRF